jgi:Domain of unknown function (DUF4288)
MSTAPITRWFGIRTIFLWGKRKNDGLNVFEERVVVFSADTVEDALAKAEREAEEYAAANRMEAQHGLQVAYYQDGDPLIDGYEVWSELYQSSENLESFVQSRYEKYNYHPDP